MWNQFCSARTLTLSKGGDFSSKLSAGDLELIETMKTMRGSISLRKLQDVLADISDVQDIAVSASSKTIKSKLFSGKRYSRKKITYVAKKRITYENMVYTQLFVDYLSSKDPAKVRSSTRPE